jgi:hypothetical protein
VRTHNQKIRRNLLAVAILFCVAEKRKVMHHAILHGVRCFYRIPKTTLRSKAVINYARGFQVKWRNPAEQRNTLWLTSWHQRLTEMSVGGTIASGLDQWRCFTFLYIELPFSLTSAQLIPGFVFRMQP